MKNRLLIAAVLVAASAFAQAQERTRPADTTPTVGQSASAAATRTGRAIKRGTHRAANATRRVGHRTANAARAGGHRFAEGARRVGGKMERAVTPASAPN